MKRIDAHAHVIPQAYVDAVPAPGGNLPKPPASYNFPKGL